MFAYFRFNLPQAVTEQLIERLEKLPVSILTNEALTLLEDFQVKNETVKGVYVVYQEGIAVYAGKADGIAERLSEHLWKLRGRHAIDLTTIGFKALLLDEAWSTSANEGLLIDRFKDRGECKWNGTGFGPKDPGKERDTTKPSWFNNAYPVRDDWPVENIPDQSEVGDILRMLKDQLPFLLRYEKLGKAASTPVELSGVPRNARMILVKCAQALGANWQLTLLKFGFILYPELKEFKYGERLHP
ncbi:MAG: hypothetical protein ACOYMS_09035 [Terrimicrobiaceae bacterium]